MSDKANQIVMFSILLILIGVLLPIGLTSLTAYTGAYNATATGGLAGTNSTIATLVATIIPVIIVISLIMALINRKDGVSE